MGDYLSPRKQQVVVRLRERIEKVRKGDVQSLRNFEASNPQRREQERLDTEEFHRRIIENRNKRAPRNVKAQEGGQSKVKSESNGNCSNSEMGRNQPQVVKKAVDRKRPNPDSPNLTGTTEAINRTNALSLEASGSNSGVRGDASPAKKPCVDTSKQLQPGQVSSSNQFNQQLDPNRLGTNHHTQATNHAVNNQAPQGGAAAADGDGAQDLQLFNDLGNSEDVLRLLDDPNGANLDELFKTGQLNPQSLLSELDRLENDLSLQLGEMPDMASNSPRSLDPNKQSDVKLDPASNAEAGVVPKTENSDSYDPMMEGPPNTVATEALTKSGPLPGIHELKHSTGIGVLVKQEPQQVNASQAAGAVFKGQNVPTVVSSCAQNIVPQLNQLNPMQVTTTSATGMNPSMRGSFGSQQGTGSVQQGSFLTPQQQQQLNNRQFLQNPRMTGQQNLHSRVPNPMLNNMNASTMSSADQLTQFANNSMRGQAPQHGRLPSMLQSFIPDRSQNMALSSGQAGSMMPGQASQFVGHPQQQQRMASPEILQRLQNPPHYKAGAEQRKFVANSYAQSSQPGHNMQPGNNQMLIPRRPPPCYDEAQHRNSMAFQSGPVNPGMPQQLGQQGGMMNPHMAGQPGIRGITPSGNVQGHPNNGMSAGAGNLGTHSSMMQGMAQQQPQQQSMMHHLAPHLRRQILQQQNMRALRQQSAAMGNQMNMGSVPAGNVNMGQAGMTQYQQRHMPGQWTTNPLLQQRMQQQHQQPNNFQGNGMMQQSYTTQSRFPQRNVMDTGSNMRTFQNITSQGGGAMSNVTNTNPSIITQQQFVGQPPQQTQQQQQQKTQQHAQQQQQQQPQQQQNAIPQPVQGAAMAAMQNGSAVSGQTNQTFTTNAQQMQMGMMSDNTNQQQQQQQSGSSDMLDMLENIIKNDGSSNSSLHHT